MIRILFSALVFFAVQSKGAQTKENTDFSKSVVFEDIHYSFEKEKRFIFVTFIFNKPPVSPPVITPINIGYIFDFPGVRIHRKFKYPESPKTIRNFRIWEKKISADSIICKSEIILGYLPEYKINIEGNALVMAFALPRNYARHLKLPNETDELPEHKMKKYKESLEGRKLKFNLTFDRVPEKRISYQLSNPSRLVYDFYHTSIAKPGSAIINASPVKSIHISQQRYPELNMTRVIFSTYGKTKIKEKVVKNRLELTMDSEGWKVAKNNADPGNNKWVSMVVSSLTVGYGAFWIFLSFL